MKEYIDKAIIKAELEKRLKHNGARAKLDRSVSMAGREKEDKDILVLLDTLEVKEVNLDESARYYLLHEHISPLNEVLHQADLKVEMQYHKDIEDAYKAGFELGLKAQKGE